MPVQASGRLEVMAKAGTQATGAKGAATVEIPSAFKI